MSSIINILLLRLELERKIHEQAKLPDSSQEYSMDEKLQRLKERRQGIQLDTDKGESHDAFVDWVSEPQQANRPLPVWLNLNGLPIAIENQAGTVRNGTDESGHEWSIQLQDHYGEIRDSEGADGDGVDCFVNPDYENFNHDLVFVINQINPTTGEFDEHKVMLGYNDEQEAEEAYLRNYEDGWQGLGEIHEIDYPELIDWLNGGNTTDEFEDEAN